MYKFIFAAALALSLISATAEAKRFQLGAPAVASVTIPDAWSPSVTERGVEATTDDDEIYVAVTVASASGVEDAMKQALAYLLAQGVTIEPGTDRAQPMTVNGIETMFLGFSGKDSDGEQAEISLGLFIVNPTTVLILSYWGSKEGEKTYSAELSSLLQSFTRID
jgi:hypothetical protein